MKVNLLLLILMFCIESQIYAQNENSIVEDSLFDVSSAKSHWDMSFAFKTQNVFRGILPSAAPIFSTQAGIIWKDWILGMYGGVGTDGVYRETDFILVYYKPRIDIHLEYYYNFTQGITDIPIPSGLFDFSKQTTRGLLDLIFHVQLDEKSKWNFTSSTFLFGRDTDIEEVIEDGETTTKRMESPWTGKKYTNGYRVAGMKITLDGSPQGRTAWAREPYLLPPDGQKQGYKGYPAIPEDKDVQALFELAFKHDWQVEIHANGDAAIDQLIRTMKPAAEKYGNNDRRSVLIHGQFLKKDQYPALKELNVIPSMFTMYTFYWGDWYKKIIGPEKAQLICPAKSLIDDGFKITIHTDAPVALPNLMQIVWASVNRVSRSGDIMGPDERITPYQAMQAITIWSAWQHFEDDTKGSLEPGKLADLVILSDNPLKIDPMKINTITVLETIKEGKTVYHK